MPYDIVVIGGGSAGLVAAVGAARLGARTLLIERRALGGDCLFTGCVPSKALIASARFAAHAARAAEFGFETPQIKFAGEGFASVARRVARVVETVGERDAPEVFRAEGVEIEFGSPRFLSPREVEIEGAGGGRRRVRARRFCVATGSRPAVPAVEGLREAGFVTNEEVFNLKSLPRTLAVLGGGPTGLELGQSFARLGSRVTVVEMSGRLLAKEEEEASSFVESALRGEGMELLLKTRAVGARREGGEKVLTVESEGGARREVRAEEILVAAGRRPNTEGLGLEAAGVEYDERRVVTDDYLRTTARTVYAAGDVTGRLPFTHAAAYEASLVVRNALFFWPLTQRADYRAVPWATFTDPEVARVGLTESEARVRYGERGVRVYRAEFAENDRAQADGETRGFAKYVCEGRKERIVGATVVGAHAGELIHEVALALKMKLGVAALGSLVHVYPTLTQVNQRAGVDAVLARLSSPTVRRLMSRYLSLFRR